MHLNLPCVHDLLNPLFLPRKKFNEFNLRRMVRRLANWNAYNLRTEANISFRSFIRRSLEASIPLAFRLTIEARSRENGIASNIGTKPAKADTPSRLYRVITYLCRLRHGNGSGNILVQEQASQYYLKWCALCRLPLVTTIASINNEKTCIEIRDTADQVLYFLTSKGVCRCIEL